MRRPPDYPGKWVADAGGRVVAHSTDRHALARWARSHYLGDPVHIYRVPHPDDTPQRKASHVREAAR